MLGIQEMTSVERERTSQTKLFQRSSFLKYLLLKWNVTQFKKANSVTVPLLGNFELKKQKTFFEKINKKFKIQNGVKYPLNFADYEKMRFLSFRVNFWPLTQKRVKNSVRLRARQK